MLWLLWDFGCDSDVRQVVMGGGRCYVVILLWFVVVYGGIVVVMMCCGCCIVMWWEIQLYVVVVMYYGYMWWFMWGEVLCSHSPSKNNNFHTTTFSKIFFIPLAEQMFAQTNIHITLSHLYTKTLQIIQKDVIKMSIQIYRIIIQYFYLKVVTDYVP